MSRPPLHLQVIVRPVSGANTDTVPFGALQDYFETCNVDLNIRLGSPLPFDPSGSPPLISMIEEEHLPPSGQSGPAVLVLALLSPDGDRINGELLNPMRRGMVAVYTQSSNFMGGSDEDRLQIFVHEIGHLINLVHHEADESYPTAMEQWADRQTHMTIKAVWKRAAPDVNHEDRARFQAYLAVPRPSCGLPMSRKSLDHAARETTMRAIEPWRSGFRDSGQFAHFDRRTAGLSLLAELHSHRISLGEGLDFSVTLALESDAREVHIPAHIGLRFGNLLIQVQEDEGTTRTLQAKTHTCAAGANVLAPGGQWRSAYSFLRDRHGLIFTSPGHYRIDIAMPGLGMRAASMRLEVGPPLVPDLTDKRFLAFIGGAMRPTARASWKRIESLIEAESTPATLRAYLAEICIAARPERRRNTDLFDLVAALPDLPQRLQERIAIARCRHAKRATDLGFAIEKAETIFARTRPDHPALVAAIAHSRTSKKGKST